MSYSMLRGIGGEGDDLPPGPNTWCPETGCKRDDWQMVFVDLDEPVWCSQYCPEGWIQKENECGKWCLEPVDAGTAPSSSSAGQAAPPILRYPVPPKDDEEPTKNGTPAGSSSASSKTSPTTTGEATTPTWIYVAGGAVALVALLALAS